MALELDRIAVEEVGAEPVRLAAAIPRQLPNLNGAVPVYEGRGSRVLSDYFAVLAAQ